MRLAIINLTGGGMSGGYKKYLKNLLPLISRHPDIEAILCASPANLAVSSWFKTMDNVAFVNCKTFSIFGRVDIDLYAELDRFHPDVIFVPMERYFKYRDVPTISMLRNMLPLVPIKHLSLFEEMRNYVQKGIARQAMLRAQRVIAISDFVSEFLKQEWGVPVHKIGIVNHGVSLYQDIESLAPTTVPLDWQGQFIFTAGSIESYRGLEDILFAVNRLKRDGFDHKVVIAGSARPGMMAYYSMLQQLVTHLGLQENICWAGLLNDNELGWCYRNSMVYIMSSRVEACPNTALEAMSFGSLIISTTNPPMPEFFTESALYYKAGEAEALAEHITAVSRFSSAQRVSLSEGARKRSLAFTWENTVNKTILEFKNVISTNNLS